VKILALGKGKRQEEPTPNPSQEEKAIGKRQKLIYNFIVIFGNIKNCSIF